MLTQIARNTAASRTTHAGAHDLHCRHQRVCEKHGPGQRVPELRAGLRVGRDPARIVIGRATNQPGAQDPKQPRLGLDDRARTGIDGLLDFEGPWAPQLVCRPATRVTRRQNSAQYLNCGIAFN